MKEKTPLVFRIEPELHERLEECSTRTGLKKYTLGMLAIEAAVAAIERNGYRLVVPIEFDVTSVPAENPNPNLPAAKRSSPSGYPLHRAQFATAEEGAPPPARKPKAA